MRKATASALDNITIALDSLTADKQPLPQLPQLPPLLLLLLMLWSLILPLV
jgi:hypothetical protein